MLFKGVRARLSKRTIAKYLFFLIIFSLFIINYCYIIIIIRSNDSVK